MRRRLHPRPRPRPAAAERAPRDTLVVSADWGARPRKRAVCVARRDDREGWRVESAAPPREGWSLAGLLGLAERLRGASRRPAVVGIDAVLGLPAAFARAAGVPDFTDGLAWLADAGGLERESASAAAWRCERPFFRVPPGRGSLTRFLDAAGGRHAALRRIERRTGAKSVFVLSGIPGSVGSGSRALWRELAAMLRDERRGFRVWPFEGSLSTLLGDAGGIVLAETYPRASYAVALAPELPTRPRALAKTKRERRERALAELEAAPWIGQARVRLDAAHREKAAANEDDFDALFAAVALVRLIEGGHPLSTELVDPAFEGGILGTGCVTLPAPRNPRGSPSASGTEAAEPCPKPEPTRSPPTPPPLNGDLSKRVVVDTTALPWAPSPSPSVWRKRLHRVGPAESGQVTSVVRYEPDSAFPAHDHPEGEEILVLAGTFSDEHGDWPAGSYLLNPEGFRHAPFSREGCLLFVKLRQAPGAERRHVALRTDTRDAPWAPSDRPGIERMALHVQSELRDHTWLERWAPGADPGEAAYPDGVELFVLDGELADEHGRCPRGTWLRLPAGAAHRPRAPKGCTLYAKYAGLPGLRGDSMPGSGTSAS